MYAILHLWIAASNSTQVQTSAAVVKRPAHYQTLNEGISRGRVTLVRSSSSPSPPDRYSTTARKRTMEWLEADDDSTLDGSIPANRQPSVSNSPTAMSKQIRTLDRSSPQPSRQSGPFPTFVLPSESRPALTARSDASTYEAT
jgi:hypothetical protein